jgi:flagellar basal-body rod modification protein FlgD
MDTQSVFSNQAIFNNQSAQQIANAQAASLGKSKTANNEVSRDQFLQLLTVQLRSQNPLKPQENQEFASQLAQFSQLEQLQKVNSSVEKQTKSSADLAQIMMNLSSAGMVGKNVRATSPNVQFDGVNPQTLGFNLPVGAISTSLELLDSSGGVIRKWQSSYMPQGDHRVTWDGTDQNGNNMPPGRYTLRIAAKDKNDANVDAQTFTVGRVTSVRLSNGGDPTLLVNGAEVSFSGVRDIQE